MWIQHKKMLLASAVVLFIIGVLTGIFIKQKEMSLEVSNEVAELNIADDIETLYVTLDHGMTLKDVHASKETEYTGEVIVVNTSGIKSYIPVEAFCGHGNDSWEAEKKSYDIKFPMNADLFGMGANNDFVLLAGYRDNSLMSFCITGELVQELDFRFAPEFRLVNLYVAGEYLGVYFLTERMEIADNRINITNAFEMTKLVNGYPLIEDLEFGSWLSENGIAKRYFYYLENNPGDISGGYLLEMDSNNHEEVSRFASDRNNRFVFKRAKFASKEQVDYIADYWQEYENALYSENGFNEYGRYYTEYIDLESFVKQWIIYELLQEWSMHSSVYFYKESNVTGDGLLHACYPWDMEHSYLMTENMDRLWNVEEKEEYWNEYYKHEDFRALARIIWFEEFVPAVTFMIQDEAEETEDGFKNISWYKENISYIQELETGRWKNVDPMEKCESIRAFLGLRLETISRILE